MEGKDSGKCTNRAQNEASVRWGNSNFRGTFLYPAAKVDQPAPGVTFLLHSASPSCPYLLLLSALKCANIVYAARTTLVRGKIIALPSLPTSDAHFGR